MENKITFDDASKDWIIQKLRKDDMDALIIDNWYSNDELKKVFVEMDYYMNLGLDNLIRSEKDKSSARDYNGESKVKSYRFYVEPNKYSALYKYNYKYVFEEFTNMLQNETLFGGYFSNTKTNSIMVNYYENDKYYKSHKDVSVITQLTWIYREPKMFSGGDLILTDMGETIECKNNRTIFFPGHYKHEVMEVKMKDEWETEYKDKNYYGRFSIANFFQN
jgi:Rps23 Pro-64 3,4-dihydroxylase Tpa1-like proline 4-hydroxylase